MSYLDQLTSINADPNLDTSDAWHQCILDHRMYLRSISQKITPTPDIMTQIQYDLAWVCRQFDRSGSLAWIVGIINDINAIDFNSSMTLYLPTNTQIKNLYAKFQTYQAIAASASV